jgi:uncharacterized membrane protein
VLSDVTHKYYFFRDWYEDCFDACYCVSATASRSSGGGGGSNSGGSAEVLISP